MSGETTQTTLPACVAALAALAPEPTPRPCPDCGGEMVLIKAFGEWGIEPREKPATAPFCECDWCWRIGRWFATPAAACDAWAVRCDEREAAKLPAIEPCPLCGEDGLTATATTRGTFWIMRRHPYTRCNHEANWRTRDANERPTPREAIEHWNTHAREVREAKAAKATPTPRSCPKCGGAMEVGRRDKREYVIIPDASNETLCGCLGGWRIQHPAATPAAACDAWAVRCDEREAEMWVPGEPLPAIEPCPHCEAMADETFQHPDSRFWVSMVLPAYCQSGTACEQSWRQDPQNARSTPREAIEHWNAHAREVRAANAVRASAPAIPDNSPDWRAFAARTVDALTAHDWQGPVAWRDALLAEIAADYAKTRDAQQPATAAGGAR